MKDRPLATVVIPARNEEGDLARCLEAVLCQDYPLDRLEVLVVDGGSVDGTAEVAKEMLSGHRLARAEVLSNPVGTTPSNLNLGVALAEGEVLCRVDARSIIPSHYVRTCVGVLLARPDIAVVGGSQVAAARAGAGVVARGIERALNNPFVMGFSRYRRQASSGESDTVYLGAFRTGQLREVDGWDERLTTNQDFDLSRRMSQVGTVWFEAPLEVEYLPREGLLALFRQYLRFGEAKVRYWRLTGDRPRPRQLALLIAPSAGSMAALGWALRRPPRGPRIAATLLAGVGGLLAIDAVGNRGRAADSRCRATAVVASALIAGGWVLGVLRALGGRR
jgi:succinoglycan biosynthesis protein ExoA